LQAVRAIIALAALDFDELGDQRILAAVQERVHGLALRFQP
jgi:hypothetical protein